MSKKKLFNPDFYLKKAEKEFLLNNTTRFIYPIRHTKDTRQNYALFEQAINKYPDFKISRYRDEKDGKTKVGRACEITFTVNELFKFFPGVKTIHTAWQAAKNSSKLIDVAEFISNNYSECRKKPEQLKAAVIILEYLLNHSNEVIDLYPRQIPHGQSTKIIGYESLLLSLYSYHMKIEKINGDSRSWDNFYRNFKLKRKPISFHFFADKIYRDDSLLFDIHALISSDNIQHWGLKKFKNILIVENEETFFPLHGNLPGWLIIWGSGNKISGANFLQKYLTGNVYYWGDMDKEGYEIFASTQNIFFNLIPIAMDVDTLQRYLHLSQVKTKCEAARKIPQLDEAYRFVCQKGILIEQEQIDLNEIIHVIQNLQS